MISGRLLVVYFEIFRGLVLIDFEVEVGLGLDIAVDLLSESLLLLELELLLEIQCVDLLLDQGADSVLDLLEVIVVALLNLRDLREDAFLLPGRSQLRQPFGLCCIFLLLLLQVGLRVVLQLLEIATVESGLDVAVQLCRLGGLLCLEEVLDGKATEGAIAWLEQARQERLVCC